jgi:hypothetical protein
LKIWSSFTALLSQLLRRRLDDIMKLLQHFGFASNMMKSLMHLQQPGKSTLIALSTFSTIVRLLILLLFIRWHSTLARYVVTYWRNPFVRVTSSIVSEWSLAMDCGHRFGQNSKIVSMWKGSVNSMAQLKAMLI